MAGAIAELYDTMTETEQQELYDFALSLVSKRERAQADKERDEREIQERLTALYEFAGSMKDLWKGVDALEYQRKLREERDIG